MNDDQKQKFDMIHALRSAAWASSDARRDAEWRVALGLWTALAALIGILLGRDLKVNAAIKWGGVAFVALLVFFHALFTRGLQNANRYDRDTAEFYDNLLEREVLAANFPSMAGSKWEELKERRKQKLKETLFANYSHRFQVLVTLLFALCLIGVLASK